MWAPEEGAVKTPLLKGGNVNDRLSPDPTFRGVKQEREFRDVVFAILFLIVFGLMITVGALGFSNGDPSKLPVPSKTTIEGEVDSYMTKAVAYLKQDINFLACSMVGAVLLAFVWTQAMKWFTKAFIYIMMFLGLAAMIALGVYLYILGSGANATNSDLKYLSYIIWGVSFVLIIVIFFLRKKIALTAALFKEACRGLQHNPSLFLVSIIVIVLFLAFAAFWVSSFIYLYSVPEDFQVPNPSGSSGAVIFKTSYRNLMWFQLFAGLWTTYTLGAIFQHSIAGGFASWYFSQNSANKPASPAFKALGWGFTKSFGSLAFGSLIVAIVAFINFLLEKAKQSNQTNKVLQAILSCIQCCLGSIQSMVEWINKFAFIYIAMHGDNFCASAKGVFKLMSRNFFSAVVVDLISDFVLFFGKLLGACLVTLITIGVMDGMDHPVQLLTVILIAIGTYLVFSLFASIISTGVDTVLICYLEDLERNKDGALNMNIELHNMLQERTQKLRSENPNV